LPERRRRPNKMQSTILSAAVVRYRIEADRHQAGFTGFDGRRAAERTAEVQHARIVATDDSVQREAAAEGFDQQTFHQQPSQPMSGNRPPDDQAKFGPGRIERLDVQIRDSADFITRVFQHERRIACRVEFAHFVFDERGQFARLVQETQLDFFRVQPLECAAQGFEIVRPQRAQHESAAIVEADGF